MPAPITRAVAAQFELARNTNGGDKGELHIVKLEEEAVSVSLQVEGE